MPLDPRSLPPEQSATVKPFDPLVLDRTVIAIPLLEEMRQELALIKQAESTYPQETKKFSAAIELNAQYPNGVPAARAEAEQIVRKAGENAIRASNARLKLVSQESRQQEQERHVALQRAIDAQFTDAVLHGHYLFANLHASVVRRILALNERADPRPILRILPTRFQIIIDLNLEYPKGREGAREWVMQNFEPAKEQVGVRDPGQIISVEKSRLSKQYLFARLEARAIQKLVELDMAAAEKLAKEKADKDLQANPTAPDANAALADQEVKRIVQSHTFRAIYHIWPDFPISACINKSISTVKADAAQNSFSARGTGITWAVMDSGIDATHEHFVRHRNIDPNSSWHRDFTSEGSGPLVDENGHGTHVAGIIAGEWPVSADTPLNKRPLAVSRYRKKDKEDIEYQETRLDRSVAGMAPECKLVSLKVLDENGKGEVSNLMSAIAHVQEINGYGRRLLIHGINMSVGYNFEPEWFACGQSPLCEEVDRLVKTGVIVVVAAGNTGYGTLKSSIGATAAGLPLTINDPGNADLAITVGSTHRDKPHIYGVSYFSSKGPTGDGRLKPDLVAPGEKIISCATGLLKAKGAEQRPCDYVETSGTSMAAPHVSGVIAGFLSVRGEFIGKAERVKEIFVSTATDLRRDHYFQGAGLVDLMRAIQSV